FHGVIGLVTSVAVDHARLELVTPPIFGGHACSRRILPFSFSRKPVFLLSDLREPFGKLSRVTPAHIGNRGITIIARYSTGTCVAATHCFHWRTVIGNLPMEKGLMST